jgi:MYXO-CTERM domain-containing protein
VRFEHSFTVPTDIETAWRNLADIDRVAPCIPGATIESVAGDEVNGSIRVRLGSIGPTYKGTMTFVQRDHGAHRFVLKAHAETRTSGSATAGVVATLAEFGGSTTVLIISDVEFTGKAGQLEASVIADSGTRLVRQFAQRFADVLAADPAPEPTTPAEPEPGPESPAPATPAEEPQMAQSQEPTPTPSRSADADIGDESPPQVMPQRAPSARSSSPDRSSTPDRSAPSRRDSAPAPDPGAGSGAQSIPPAAIGAVVLVLLLVIRRRRRKRRRG